MRKIIKTNDKIETYQALDSVVKYLSNCYNKWDIVIMKFSTKYNLIFKNNEICFDLDKIYNTLFTNSNKEYNDMLYFDKITFRTTTKYQEEGAEESELTIDKINNKEYIVYDKMLAIIYKTKVKHSTLILYNGNYNNYEVVKNILESYVKANNIFNNLTVVEETCCEDDD